MLPEELIEIDEIQSARYESYSVSSSLDTGGPTSQKSHRQKSSQLTLSFDRFILKELLCDRIEKIDPENPEGTALRKCHTEETHVLCRGCNEKSVWWNRCDRRFCPICAPRVARDRQRQLTWWFSRVKHPKMLTLTIRNLERIDGGEIDDLKKTWQSLRRSKLFEPVKGGFWSLEITNQGKGWHAHIHAVLESCYLPQDEIEKAWSKRVGQSKSIVDIRGLKGPDPLKEVVKYTAKPTQMVHWSDEDLLQFLAVAPKLRLFGCWGSCYKLRSDYREFLDELRSEYSFCTCGCNSWKILDAMRPELHKEPPKRPPPPPQLSLSLDTRHNDAVAAIWR